MKIVKIISLIAALALVAVCFTGCSSTISGSEKDTVSTIQIADNLSETMPTPTDIDYSLERYNLIRRAYWVNGMREKAMSYPCPISNIPIGYVILLTESGSIIGKFMVNGKVTSLNSYLTPDSEYYELCNSGTYTKYNNWLADVDGSYGENDNGIFFFTVDGKYIEWSGTYLYSDIPFEVSDPIVRYEVN